MSSSRAPGSAVVTGSVVAVCTRAERTREMRKPPVGAITLRRDLGVVGDAHAGPGDRQVALVPAEVLEALRAEGFPLAEGDLGENLVLRGLPEEAYRPGARIRLGEHSAVIEVTQPRKPCRELNDIAPGLLRAAVGRCGFFARVLEDGQASAGDPARFLDET